MRPVQNPAQTAAAWGSPAQRLPCGLQSLLVGISVLSPALSQPQCSLHVQPTALALHCTSCCEVKEVRGQCVGCEAEDSSNSRPQTRQQIRCGVRPVDFAPHWCAPLSFSKGVGVGLRSAAGFSFLGVQHPPTASACPPQNQEIAGAQGDRQNHARKPHRAENHDFLTHTQPL